MSRTVRTMWSLLSISIMAPSRCCTKARTSKSHLYLVVVRRTITRHRHEVSVATTLPKMSGAASGLSAGPALVCLMKHPDLGRRAGPNRLVASRELRADVLEFTARELAWHRDRIDVVEVGTVQAENFALDLLRQLRIAITLLELVRNLERPHRLDLILWRAVEQTVRPPQNIVLADVLEQLSDRVTGLLRRTHHVPPRGAELRVHVLVGTDVGLPHRVDEPVDAQVRGAGRIRTLRDPGFETRVIDDEVRVGVLPGSRTYVGWTCVRAGS